MLTEAEDHEERLKGDLYYGFTDESSTEEDSEGDQEVTAQEPGQVEEGVRNLLNSDKDEITEARTRMAIKACFCSVL